MDLKNEYHQLQIKEGDGPKMVCVTHYGSFEFCVMPFGLTNAPSTFCCMMDNVFWDYIDHFVVVYLDNIFVYNQSLDDRVRHMRKMMAKLKEHELYLKPKKYLLKNNAKWQWTNRSKIAFYKLKNTVSSELVLRWPRLDKPYKEGHHVAYDSTKLNDAKRRYSKKLTPKQVKWQDFLTKFDFNMNHKLGHPNQVLDAFSPKELETFVTALSTVQGSILDDIKLVQDDPEVFHLMKCIAAGERGGSLIK
ncbi:uncharacterized protein LOC144701407 [Wolffia australiana]